MSIRLTLFAIITIIVVIWTFRKPKIGLFYFLGLLILRDGYLMENVPELYFNWHLPIIAGWLIFVSWLCSALSKGDKVHKPIELFLLVFLGCVIYLSRFYASYSVPSVEIFGEYIRIVVLVFLIINIIKTEADLKQIALVLISLMTFLVVYAYYRYKVEGFEYAIPSQYYVDRNFFAESIVSILPMAFMFYEENARKVKKYIFLGIVAIMAGGVVLTYSRGGLLALFIVLAGLFLVTKKKVSMAAVGLLILIVFMPHIGAKYTERMNTVTKYEQDPSAMIRIATWNAGLNMVKERPLLGVGAGNFNGLFIQYTPDDLSKFADYTMSIHNNFIQIFSETGIIGGSLFVAVIIIALFGIMRLNGRNKRLPPDKQIVLIIPNMLGISLLGFCGAGFFLPGVYYGYQYIIIAMIIAGRIIYNDKLRLLENQI